jgi:hypothetical protein
VPYLVVVHRPVGSYAGSIAYLCSDAAQASAHVITDSSREATQLVHWDRKAWACKAFNSASYNVEVDDNAWDGSDPDALATAARIVGFLCRRTGIPPKWSSNPLTKPGVIRHYDLGIAGGGHSDPTTDLTVWSRFIERVKFEHDRGGFLPSWGLGELHRLDV